MALQDFIAATTSAQHSRKLGVSPERINAIKPIMRQYIAFWREYPDMFVDFMQTGYNPDIKPTFQLYAYQRVFLRIAIRYRYVYVVQPRAYSKSFLSVLILMIRAILYPGAQLFSTAGGKEQAASILEEKVQDICTKIPAFKREIDWRRGSGTTEQKDNCKYVFKSGSSISNLAARESSRGQRRHGGLIEECVGVDQKILQEVVIPTMNVSRRCADGTVQEEEVLNQSQIYITTAGYKGTFSYDKLIQVLVQMITEPEKAFVMGGTYRVPQTVGLISKKFIQDVMKDTSFNEASFQREYESKWTGSVEDAFFNGERFDRSRVLQKPEYEYSNRSTDASYYVIAMDVGRRGCDSVFNVIKVVPQATGLPYKNIVNIIKMADEHFEDQAIMVKKLFYQYRARRMVIDGNGIGMPLIDYLVKSQTDSNTGEVYPPFGIYNDKDNYYKKYITPDTELDAIYIIKAHAPENTAMHSNFQSQLNSGKLKFLISERDAKAKLLGTKLGQGMTPEERNEYLMPYQYTSILKDELMNLREENEGVNIILKQANKRIKKDTFSSLEMGLYYIMLEEENKKKKKRFSAKDWKFYN